MSPQEAAQHFHSGYGTLTNSMSTGVSLEDLTEMAIVHLLEELDPHSVYFSAEELQEADEPLNGNFEGIGVQFNIFKDTSHGGLSHQRWSFRKNSGIRSGDRIVKVDGENCAGIGITNREVMKLLKGPKGTVVQVGIFDEKGESELIEFDIVRDKIPIFSLDAVHMIDDEIGYIKVSRFAKTTMDEFQEGLLFLKNKE